MGAMKTEFYRGARRSLSMPSGPDPGEVPDTEWRSATVHGAAAAVPIFSLMVQARYHRTPTDDRSAAPSVRSACRARASVRFE